MTDRMECPIAWCNGDIDNHGGVGQEPSEWLHVDHGRDIVHGAAIYRTQKGSAPVRWEMVVGGRVVAVHCCAPDVPLALLRSAGAAAISLDTALLTPAAWESVAVTVEAGVALWAGIDLQTHSASGARGAAEAAIEPLRRHWRELGLPAETLDGVVVTPPCGLAGLSPAAARAVHRLGIDAARALTEGARA